jgi:hypothetical protein
MPGELEEKLRSYFEENELKVLSQHYIPGLSHSQAGSFISDTVANFDLEGDMPIESVVLNIPNEWAMNSEFRTYFAQIIQDAFTSS